MTGKVKGRGMLRHHFWGTYYASVVIGFDSKEDALSAQRVLGMPWLVSNVDPRGLMCFCGSEGLALVKEQMGVFGADVDKIDSVAKSIDFGEPWEIIVPVVAIEQQELFK